MGLRFRKSIKIAPGVRLNLSKSGVSTTVGARGASVNIGKSGTYLNAGIPGTGLYMREKIGESSNQRTAHDTSHTQGHPRNGLPGTEASSYFVFVGTIVIGTAFFLPSFYLFYKAYKRYKAKVKPVYGEEGVYTTDRRYKSGQRLTGLKKVIVGYEPLTDEEKAASRQLGLYRLIVGAAIAAFTLGAVFLALQDIKQP